MANSALLVYWAHVHVPLVVEVRCLAERVCSETVAVLHTWSGRPSTQRSSTRWIVRAEAPGPTTVAPVFVWYPCVGPRTQSINQGAGKWRT